MSCPSWSEPSHSGSSFEHGRGTVAASGDFCFSSARSALRVGQQPGRRGRQRGRRIEDGGRIGEADRRPDHPAMRLDLVGDERVAIVRHRLEAAEHVLGIVDDRPGTGAGPCRRRSAACRWREARRRARRRTARGRSPATTPRAGCGGNCRAAGGSSARGRATGAGRSTPPCVGAQSRRQGRGRRVDRRDRLPP